MITKFDPISGHYFLASSNKLLNTSFQIKTDDDLINLTKNISIKPIKLPNKTLKTVH